jgi:Ca2+-binding RTX toxin-like protein
VSKSHVALTLSALALGATALLSQPSAQAATPTCFGQQATFVGTDGSDSLVGGPDDVVVGGAGNDWLYGAVVCGGSGDDHLFGLDHINNKLDGGRGTDQLMGSFGADVMLGRGGDDRIIDTDDEDYPDVDDPGVDIMRGGPGDDRVESTAGSDRVYGGDGNDLLRAFTRAETWLYGGDGNDNLCASRLDNEAGANPFEPDHVIGNRGYDTAYVDKGEDVLSSIEKVLYPSPSDLYACPPVVGWGE